MDPSLITDLIVTATSAPGLGDTLGGLATGASGHIQEYLFQTKVFITGGAIYLIPQLMKRMPGLKKLWENQWFVRFLPLYPLVAAMIAMFIPGMIDLPDNLFGTKVVIGVYLAAVAMFAHKFLGQTVMGDDDRIDKYAVESRGQRRRRRQGGGRRPIKECN